MHDLVHQVKEFVTHLDPMTVLVLTGLITSAVHGLINRFKQLETPVNRFVSFVLPVAGAILSTLVEPTSGLIAYPVIFTSAQAAYRVYKNVVLVVTWLKLGKSVSKPQPVTTAPAATLNDF